MAFTNTYIERQFRAGIEYGLVKTAGITSDVNGLGTPFTVLSAVTGKVIKVQECWFNKVGTAVHNTSTTLWLLTDTATRPQAYTAESLLSSVATNYPGTMNAGGWGATDTIMIVSKGLVLQTSNLTNPGGGTASAVYEVYTRYMIYTP